MDFSEDDLELYQQFEGERPSVLDRINAEPKELEDQHAGDIANAFAQRIIRARSESAFL